MSESDLKAEIAALRNKFTALLTEVEEIKGKQRSTERERRFQELCLIDRTGTIEQIKAATERWNADVRAGRIRGS